MLSLNNIPNPPLDAPPFQEGAEDMLDWDARLSIEHMREHTKTDDVPAVTDNQLRLYRSAAIEAAEQYTGMLLSRQRMVSEPIQGGREPRPGKTTYTVRLKYPVADGWVYLYGGTHPMDNKPFRVPIGTRKVQVPIRKDMIDLSNCCDPCSTWNMNGGMMAMYKAGFRSSLDVPAGIVVGCLQFIAWVVEHAGDELLTQRNRVESRAGLSGLQGSNNIAMVSGAIESWRRYDEEAI